MVEIKKEYNPRAMIETKLEEKRKQEEFENKVTKQKEEIAKLLNLSLEEVEKHIE